MPSPSTHQPTPKAPEKTWPPVVLNRRHPDERDVNYHVYPPDLPPMTGESETYAPVSALLSDEAKEAAVDRFEQRLKEEEFGQFEFPESFMHEAIKAAIEHVGGVE